MTTQFVPIITDETLDTLFLEFQHEPLQSIRDAELAMRYHDRKFHDDVYLRFRNMRRFHRSRPELLARLTNISPGDAKKVQAFGGALGSLFVYAAIVREWETIALRYGTSTTLPKYETFEHIAQSRTMNNSVDHRLLSRRDPQLHFKSYLLSQVYDVPELLVMADQTYGILCLCRDAFPTKSTC